MKKTYFKKALSLFMAVMMLMSCWVFVAPEKAEAATAVSYPVTVEFKYNSGTNGGHIVINYREVNADGSLNGATGSYTFINSLKTFNSTSGNYIISTSDPRGDGAHSGNVPGIPYEIIFRAGPDTSFTLYKVKIGNLTVMDGTWSVTNGGTKTWPSDGTGSYWGNAKPPADWTTPYPKEITGLTGVSGYTIPKIGYGKEDYFTRSATVKDQYGVTLPVPADYTISTSPYGGNAPGTGIRYSTSENRIYVSEEAQKLNPGASSSTYYLIASKGNATTYATINLTHPKYTVTFNNANGQALQSLQYYYGASVTAPTSPVKNPDNTYHYTFSHWSTSEYTYVEKDLTVNPQYTFATHNFNGNYVTSNGAHARKCAGCSMTGIGTTGGVTEPCTGDWELWNGANSTHTKTCRTCGNTDSHNTTVDSWNEVADEKYLVSPATCESPAKYYKSCSICGLAHTRDTFTSGEAAAHSFTVEQSRTPHTCTENGYVTYKCANCSETFNQYYDNNGELLDPAAHTWADDLSEKDENNHGKVCTVCEAEWAEVDEHSWTLTSTETEPTCTEKGSGTESCECGATRAVEIPATGHQNTVTDNGKDATCTEDGYTAGVYCSDCKTWIEGHEEIESDGHDLTATAANPATCETAGNIAYWTCSVCDKIYSDADTTEEITLADTVITASGHAYESEVTKEPTCITAGVRTYTCKNDPTHTYEEAIDATGEHEYGDWEWHNGGDQHIRYCSNYINCNMSETEGHTFTEDMQPAVQNGFHNYKCAECEARGAIQNGTHKLGWIEECTDAEKEYDNKTATTHTAYCACGRALIEGHDWEGWVANPANTTDGTGTMTNTCLECDYVWESACNYEKMEDVASTCTEQGHTTYECKDCTNGYTVKKDLAAHTEETIPAVEATCTATGLTAGVKCSVCDEVLVEQTETPKAAHTPGAAATCTTAQTCTVCGTELAPKAEHTEETIPALEATCTATGLTAGKKCSVCDEVFVAQTETPKADHTPGAAATCIAAQTCTVCGEELAPKAAHTEETIPAVEATCKETGLTEGKKCSVCGEILVAQEVVDKTAHTEEIIPAVDATCTATGLTAGVKCSVCDEVLVEQTETPKADHTPGAAATCTTAQTCTVCGTELAPKAEHTEETIPALEATCTATGLTAGKKCSVCDEVLVEQTETPKADHTPGAAATCTTAQTCTVCGTELAPKAEHTEETIPALEATCTATGLTAGKKCSVCDEVLVAQTETPKADHTPGAAATCIAAQTCTVCGEELAPKAAHTEETIPAVEATCKETGLTEGKKCSVCGEILVAQEVVDKTAHTEEIIPAVDATCIAIGLTEGKKCSVCGEILVVQEVVEKLAHTGAEAVRENEVDATCVDGSYDEVVYCSVCGTELSRETIKIPAISDSHTPAEAVKENIVGATSCKEPGSYEEVVYCSVCGEELSRETITTESIPHTWGTKEENRIEATCEHDGSYIEIDYCTVCDSEFNRRTVTIPALPHAYVEEPGRDATCSEYGYSSYRQCLDCGYIDGKVIYPVTEHTDENGDGICDDCNVKLDGDGAFVCVCICHTTNWFLRIVQTIVRWFWKIFGVNRICACGSYHY